MKKALIASLLTLSSLCFAGDVSNLTLIGGSEDGATFAFMESGIQDGSGFAYARVRVLDTAKNHYIATFDKAQTDDDVEKPASLLFSVQADAMTLAAPTLLKYSVSPYYKGTSVLTRKVTDLAARKLTDFSFSVYPMVQGLTSPTYKLVLSQIKATTPAGVTCMNQGVSKKLKLELVNDQTKKTSILQADVSLPKSRGCAHKYEIEEVVVVQPNQMSEYASKIIVFVRVFEQGFEGEDVRLMAISGSLNTL